MVERARETITRRQFANLDLRRIYDLLTLVITPRQYDVICILVADDSPHVTNVEIAEELQISVSAVTQLRARIRKKAEILVADGIGASD